MTATSISEAFAFRAERGQAALVPYVTAGHPFAGATAELLLALSEAGADVLELGIPFSDPLADGPTIQRSSFESLARGTTVASVLAELGSFRSRATTPVVLFTYLNPVLRYGVEAFLADATQAGAQGLLLTDLPVGADPGLEETLRGAGLDLIRLLAPTTPAERIPLVTASGSGFLYYVSRTGVTGTRESLRDSLAEEVGLVRSACPIPVAVGFGISTPEQAAAVAAVADGVVVGSALIQALDRGGIEAGADFVGALRAGMDAV